LAKDDTEVITESEVKPERKAIVIDANVIIKQIRLREVMGASDDQDFGDRFEVHTIADVIKEIKDEQARAYLECLPYELTVHDSVPEDSFDFVKSFAKETGDLKTLSWVDMKVIALGVHLSKEQGEWDRVKKAPKPLQEFKPKRFEDDYKRVEEEDESDESSGSSEDEESEEEVKPAGRRQKNPSEGEGFDDGFEAVKPKKHGDKRNHIQAKPKAELAIAPVAVPEVKVVEP
jgi:rRNA maturation endonuclease Nob1